MKYAKTATYLKLILTLMLLGIVVPDAGAQSFFKKKKERLDSVLSTRYNRVKYDTSYITRPDTRLTLKARLNFSGDNLYARENIDGKRTTADLSTRSKNTISFGVSYLGLSVALALNPASLFKKNKDYELNLNFYSRRFCIDASYHNAKTLSGDIKGSETYRLKEGIVDMKVVNLAAYYTFNHRRFSYPAAFTQSYIQRRSAGSWLAGLTFQGGVIKTTIDAPPSVPQVSIGVARIGLGGGYAYNFVIRKKWLIHLSAMPSIVAYNYNKMKVNGEAIASQPIRFNMLFNEHLAIVHNFSTRYFAGVTAVMNNSLFDDKHVVVNQNKWRVRAFFGMRLGSSTKK